MYHSKEQRLSFIVPKQISVFNDLLEAQSERNDDKIQNILSEFKNNKYQFKSECVEISTTAGQEFYDTVSNASSEAAIAFNLQNPSKSSDHIMKCKLQMPDISPTCYSEIKFFNKWNEKCEVYNTEFCESDHCGQKCDDSYAISITDVNVDRVLIDKTAELHHGVCKKENFYLHFMGSHDASSVITEKEKEGISLLQSSFVGRLNALTMRNAAYEIVVPALDIQIKTKEKHTISHTDLMFNINLKFCLSQDYIKVVFEYGAESEAAGYGDPLKRHNLERVFNYSEYKSLLITVLDTKTNAQFSIKLDAKEINENGLKEERNPEDKCNVYKLSDVTCEPVFLKFASR